MAKQETKRESTITTKVDLENAALFIEFPRIDKRLAVMVADLDPMIVQQATFHGLKQKLIDAAAISRNPETGKSATDADKYLEVLEVFNRITATEGAMWNAPREGGDGSASMLAKALMRHTGKSRSEVDEWLKAKSDAEKKALRANPKIAAIITAIQAEAAPADVDSDELLDELA